MVWSEDFQHEAVVVWDGEALDEGAVLLYGTASGKYDLKAPLTESGLYIEGVKAAKKNKKPAKPKKKPAASSPDLSAGLRISRWRKRLLRLSVHPIG